MQRLSTIGFLLILGYQFSAAQNAVFSANASAQKMGVQDQLQVDYTIQNVDNLRSISRPDFKDFEVSGPYTSQSSNISIVGNKMVQNVSVTHSYVLHPKRTGILSIPAAIAKDADGHTYQSNDLKLEVVAGSLAVRRQPQQQRYDPFGSAQQRQQAAQEEEKPVDMDEVYKNLFIKVTVDKSKASVGEQITASYKLYARLPMNVGISKLPSLNGFWTQDFEIARGGGSKPTEEILDGKTYQVFLLKKSALFPQQTGILTLDPAEAEGTARIMQKVRQRNPFAGLFDNDPFVQQFGSLMMSDPFFNDDFFSSTAYRDVQVKLKSQPVKITITDLPQNGKPAEYGNAVGNFTITGKADKTKLTTDDALNFTITISGSGNIKLIQAPELKLPNGLSTYDPVIIDTITGRTTTISGSKIITYSIAPGTPGDYEIPAVPFSYYDPQKGTYITLNTQPIKIHVDKGKNYAPNIVKNRTLADIHPQATAPVHTAGKTGKPLFFTVGYWSMYALPLLSFAAIAFWRRREDELSKDMIRLRNRRANKIATKRLSAARKYLQQNSRKEFYEEISKAIWLYLSDKLNIPLSFLSKENAHEALTGKNIPSVLLQQMDAIIEECETALYAPSSGGHQMQNAYNQATVIISKLEESI